MLIDDPTSAVDIADAYLGEIMLEAASAADTVGVGSLFGTDVVEAVTALDVTDWIIAATTTYNGTPSAGIVMSNGNLTVTHGTTSNGTGVNSTAFLTTGKYYFEVTVQVATFNGNHLGLYQSGTFASATSTGKATAVVAGSSTTNIYSNGANTTKNLGITAVGDVFGFAIDLTNRLAWIRRNNGNWNADAAANPVTGVGGVTILATGSFAPYVAFLNGPANNAFTGNFGQSAFVNSAPSGFGYW